MAGPSLKIYIIYEMLIANIIRRKMLKIIVQCSVATAVKCVKSTKEIALAVK